MMAVTSTPLQEAGRRLEEYVRFHMTLAGINGIAELCRRADVLRATPYQWFGGRTTPSPKQMERVAHALGRPVAEMWAAWEGRELRPPTLEEALGKQTEALERVADRLDALLRKMNARESQRIAEDVRRALDAEGPPPG